jgi:hypothetical protein
MDTSYLIASCNLTGLPDNRTYNAGISGGRASVNPGTSESGANYNFTYHTRIGPFTDLMEDAAMFDFYSIAIETATRVSSPTERLTQAHYRVKI